MRSWIQSLAIALLFSPAVNAASLNGNALALRSDGQSSGNSFVLSDNGFVGTYITLAEAGNVTIDVSAEGLGGAAMGLAVGDGQAAFAVAAGSNTYSHTFALPAGTHFVRTELNNDRGAAGRQLKVNSLAVSGATFANTHNNANALAASDTYIANFRRGPAVVRIPELSVGEQVGVSLKRIGFDFGTGVHASDEGDLLDNANSARKRIYQQHLNQNFNTISTAGPSYWLSNEKTRGDIEMRGTYEIQNYAAAHNMKTRLHNLLWEGQQPDWVVDLKEQAVTSDAAKADLLAAIDDRIDYYIGETQFDEIDVYNESWNDGVLNGTPETYWQLYGPSGIAKIYHDAGQAAPAAKMFVNDFAILQGSSNRFNRHIDTLQQTGTDAGYGEVVDGIGLQFYTANPSANLASSFFYGLQNMNVQELPIVLTEFGTFLEVNETDSAAILNQAVRLMFGNPNSTGFLLWEWTKENGGGGTQFATGAALYNVDTSDWNSIAITPAGKQWQDLLGIQDWDGNPANGWNTQLTATAAADGTIAFNGFYGDYEITVDGQTYELGLTKGITDYVLGDSNGLDGDFNFDGRVDAADYTVWRDGGGALTDYNLWRSNFGRAIPVDETRGAVPEASSLILALLALPGCAWRLRTNAKRLEAVN